MNAANIQQSDFVPYNILFFPTPAGFSRRMNGLPPSGARTSKRSADGTSKSRPSRPPEDPISESQLSELFAEKRAEKPPENFLPDFLAEFRRRNYGSGEQLA